VSRVLYSGGRVLLGIVVGCILAIEPVRAEVQMEVQQVEVMPQVQQQAQPIEDMKELVDISPEAYKAFEEKHKDEDCVFLLYDVEIDLHEDWTYTRTTRKKLKILKESARSMGEIPIYYERGREEITELKAYTVAPDGKRHKYSRIQDLNINEGYSMYSDYMMKVITLPEVNVGSVLEYGATMESRGMAIRNAFWDSFDFGSNVPIKELRYSITFPKAFNIQYKEFNLKHKPEITEGESTINYSWRVLDIEDSTLNEAYLPPPTVDTIRDIVEFSSIQSWGDVSDWYYSLVQENLKITPEITKAAEKALEGRVGTEDRARAILEYIQENFRYVSMSFGDNTLEPHPTNEVFKNKYGDCKDLSLLCMAMLRLAGIESHIALFNDEFSITDPVHDPPFPTLFNHVLLLVEDPGKGEFYIDPLLDGYDIGEYPMSYQNAYTFIITEDGGRFGRFPVFDERRLYIRKEWLINIEPDGSSVSELQAIWDMGLSRMTRKMFKAMDDEEKKIFFEILESTIVSGGEVLERHIEGVDQRYGPMKSYSKVRIEDKYPITDDMIIINIKGREREGGEFTEKERKCPVFYPHNALDEGSITYRIPEGFRVSYMPENLDLDIGFFNIKRVYRRKGNEIIITEKTRHKRLEVPTEEYGKVKDFFNSLCNRTTQRIVLKKAKPWWQEIRDIFRRFKK